ncbi:MAG TPA: hypothetical protein VM871_10880, partial [Flavisolibacter sp.]|nr:hypothetical protein [Flavisolibacter sp.]
MSSSFMTILTILPRTSLFFITFFFLASCVVVKNAPQDKPFVYQTNVHVAGEFKEDERKELELQLADQLHDSIRVKTLAKFAGWDKGPKLFYEVLNNPTPFDSLDAEKSKQFMKDLLHARGYFRDSIRYEVKIDTAKGGQQFRTFIDFYVLPNTVTKIDSIGFRLNADTSLKSVRQIQNLDTIQKITLEKAEGSLLKKGVPFSKYTLSAERDRLADVYRNNGYLRFSEEEMLVLWDTVGIEFLRPTLDPIEQARLLQQQAERRSNPAADV